MARRNSGQIQRFLRNFRGRPNRFKQVQSSLRRENAGKLPLTMYGIRDILTKEQWKKTVERYNSKEMLEGLNKIEAKVRMEDAGLKVPETFMIIETEEDLARFRQWLREWKDGFAMKPASGHGGSGIKVMERRVASRFISISGKGLEAEDLVKHADRIIRGIYTRGEPDRAIIERRLVLSKSLRELLTPGLMDIRVVVLRGFPLMAMTRLPTRRSKGRANIHQGAIGAGISISEGRIDSATLFRRNVIRHPFTGRQVVGFRFNMWEEILETASLAADSSGLGFVGVDLTVDKDLGVVVIEVNKRPGLEIQNANKAGLRKRIKWVESNIKKKEEEILPLGPGIKAELSRKWDGTGWRRSPIEPSEE